MSVVWIWELDFVYPDYFDIKKARDCFVYVVDRIECNAQIIIYGDYYASRVP